MPELGLEPRMLTEGGGCSPELSYRFPHLRQNRSHTRHLQFMDTLHYRLPLDGRACGPPLRGDSPRNAPPGTIPPAEWRTYCSPAQPAAQRAAPSQRTLRPR